MDKQNSARFEFEIRLRTISYIEKALLVCIAGGIALRAQNIICKHLSINQSFRVWRKNLHINLTTLDNHYKSTLSNVCGCDIAQGFIDECVFFDTKYDVNKQI